MAPPASVRGAFASDSHGVRHRAEGVGSNRGGLYGDGVRSPEGCLGTVSFKKAQKEPNNLRTSLGGEQRQTMYVRSLEMSPRSAGWEGEQRETTAVMYACTYVRTYLYVRKDVPTYVLTQVLTYVRRPDGRRRTPPKNVLTYECTYIRMTYIRTYIRTYVKPTAPLRFGSPSPACL